ncbi:MAG: PAS domain S-box-containing protein [Candidatus Electronema aureum]|uniref:histidine kinase n=1 Tax=Candidatus Electronema aureum TaxID=2005002 RepID=A0A521G2F7_9BACT|nr:MAG: PAS domain S-box-containing protein [Candidatus Electronema aureum]
MPERNLHILLIEDNEDHADLFKANLSMTAYAGSEVIRQETLRAGVEELESRHFDLLFIDLSLKDSTITETLDRLRDLGCGCPTIVLTSLDDKRTILDIIKKGADDCLPKSEMNDVLLERIIHFNLDRWRLRQELFSSKEAYKDLYHNSPNMLGCTDAKTRRVLSCNQTFADTLGYQSDEIIGREIYAFYHHDCWDQYNKIFTTFITSGIISNAELQMVRKDGSTIDVLLNASSVRNEKGEILHSRSTWVDITERKAAGRKLREIQKFNRLIIETIPDLLWLKDAKGVYLICNPRVEQLFGAPEAEIVGKTDYDFTDKEQADTCRESDLLAAAAGRALMNEEWVTFAADGKKLLLEITKVPLFDEQGKRVAVMGIGHDITERHEAAQKAEAANKAKSVFLSNMSHELRTPLNAILGYTQIFLSDDSLRPRQRSGISTIHQAGEHLLLLINDVLDISRIESGKLELIETEFCLTPFIKGIREIMKLRARDKGLDFRDEATELPAVIIADELRLRQVILNLLSNSVKFTHSGWCSLQVNAEPAGHGKVRLHIAVEDSGAGISAEDQKLVFEPFLQVGERLQHREGTGLGLAISRELVRLMGGELQLISPINKTAQNGTGLGSRFFFSIEVPISEHRAIAAQQHRKVTGYTCLRRSDEPRRVLVVDDKLSNRAVLRDTLEPLGFVVQEATDGIEVPSACQRFRPDIILMDLRMPKVDGFAAADLLKEQEEFRHIPVIAVTASIAEGEAFRQRCLQHGFADYIHKPFSAGELLEIMAAHLQVELAYSEPVLPTAAPEAMILPPQELLDELTWLAEIGEIQGIIEKSAEIAGLEAGKYRAFARQVQELAEDFQFEALQNLISPAKKEQTCTL